MSKYSAQRERGQSLVFFTLALVVLISFVALAVDGGRLLSIRRHTKAAADAGAMAAAFAWAQGGDFVAKAKAAVAANGLQGDNAAITVQQLSREECQALADNETLGAECACFRVDVEGRTQASFAQLVGFRTLAASSSSVALACKSTPLEYGYAVRTKEDLTIRGGGGVMAWGRIRADRDLIRTGGPGYGWSFGGFPLPFGGEITAGNRIECRGNFFFCNPMMDMVALGPAFVTPVEDHVSRPPLASLNLGEPAACAREVSPVSCREYTGLDDLQSSMESLIREFASAPMPSISQFGSLTGFSSFSEMLSTWKDSMESTFDEIAAGNYDEHCKVYPPGKHTSKIHLSHGDLAIFLPGEHCVTQDVKVNGGMMLGHDVTFYFERGSGIQTTAQSQLFLDAGTPGRFDFGGMLFYNPSHVNIEGGASMSMLNGSVYAPNADCRFTGHGTGMGGILGWAQVICRNAMFGGGFNAMLMYNEDHLYHLPAELSLLK